MSYFRHNTSIYNHPEHSAGNSVVIQFSPKYLYKTTHFFARDGFWVHTDVIGCVFHLCNCRAHYDDVTITTIASQITNLTVVYSILYSDADQRKHQSSASLAFVWGFTGDRWIPRTNGQLRGKSFHLMTSSWACIIMLYRMWIHDTRGLFREQRLLNQHWV